MVVTKTTTIRQKRRVRQPRTALTTVVTTRRGRRGRRTKRAARPSKGSGVDQYLKCLFAEGGAAKIPDGDNHHSVAIEFRQSQALTPDNNGNLVVLCSPALPGSLKITIGAGPIKNMDGGITTLTAIYPTGVSVPFPDFQTTYQANSYITNGVSHIKAARVVKYSMEVAQVGQVLNQQGTAATARVPSHFQSRGGAVPVNVDFSAANALWDGITYANLKGIQPAQVGSNTTLSFDSVSAFPTAKVCNATEPCMLLGKGCGNWEPCYYNEQYWYDQSNTQYGDGVLQLNALPLKGGATGGWGGNVVGRSTPYPFAPYIPASTANVLPTDFWTDPECEALVWAGANLGTSTLFEVRVTLCMELDISFGSSIYRPLVTPPAPENEVAIAKADAVMKVMPPSVSKAEGSQSWWHTLTAGVTGVAEIVGDLGIPGVSAAANIGRRLLNVLRL